MTTTAEKSDFIRLVTEGNNVVQVEHSETCWYDKKDFIAESSDGFKFYKAIAERSSNVQKCKPITFFDEGICYFVEYGEKCTNESRSFAQNLLFLLLLMGKNNIL